MKRAIRLLQLPLVLMITAPVWAGTQGHYYPGMINNRDVVMPPKGFYALIYNPNIFSDTYKEPNGDTLGAVGVNGSVTKPLDIRNGRLDITFTGTLDAQIDADIQASMYQPTFLIISDVKILGADYGFIVAPAFGSVHVSASADTTGTGTVTIARQTQPVSGNRHIEFEDHSQGLGDMYVSPFWLGWHKKRFDLGVNYGLYAPTGQYDPNKAANVGMGFWTNQMQGQLAFYPVENKATALTMQGTYGLHSEVEGSDTTPGATADLEYGLSQYVHPRVELGLVGYNHWQLVSDYGTDVIASAKDQWNGVGGMINFWAVPEKSSVSVKYNQEYAGKDHFNAQIFSLNLTWIF